MQKNLFTIHQKPGQSMCNTFVTFARSRRGTRCDCSPLHDGIKGCTFWSTNATRSKRDQSKCILSLVILLNLVRQMVLVIDSALPLPLGMLYSSSLFVLIFLSIQEEDSVRYPFLQLSLSGIQHGIVATRMGVCKADSWNPFLWEVEEIVDK